MMDATERDDLRRLAGSATDGGWLATPADAVGHVSSTPDGFGDIATTWGVGDKAEANAAFIAAANPQTVLRLLDEIDALRKGLEDAAATCDRWADESRSGGWSTHQVTPNRELAARLRALTTSSKES